MAVEILLAFEDSISRNAAVTWDSLASVLSVRVRPASAAVREDDLSSRGVFGDLANWELSEYILTVGSVQFVLNSARQLESFDMRFHPSEVMSVETLFPSPKSGPVDAVFIQEFDSNGRASAGASVRYRRPEHTRELLVEFGPGTPQQWHLLAQGALIGTTDGGCLCGLRVDIGGTELAAQPWTAQAQTSPSS